MTRFGVGARDLAARDPAARKVNAAEYIERMMYADTGIVRFMVLGHTRTGVRGWSAGLGPSRSVYFGVQTRPQGLAKEFLDIKEPIPTLIAESKLLC